MSFFLQFFALGLTSIITQVVIQRELLVTFYGNEFFIGVTLASWLIWTAVGSGLIKKIPVSTKTLILISGPIFFLEIFIIRYLKNFAGFPGEIPNLLYGMTAALLTPAPISVLLGLWWTRTTRDQPEASNRAYLYEAVGFIIGGVVFSFLLIRCQEFLTATVLVIANIIIFFIFAKRARPYILIPLIAVILLLFTQKLNDLNNFTASFRYKGQELIESVNTLYGNIAVTKLHDQYNFYENGVPMGSTAKVEATENLVHIPLLEHPAPENILLVGGGFTRAVNEILKHEPKELTYIEIDPKLIDISKKYAPIDPRAKVVVDDARHFLQEGTNKFDVIILNLPPPSTALINRYYTKEFFEIAKRNLNDGGIFVCQLTYSPSAPVIELQNLAASVFKALGASFNSTIVLPEDNIMFISSKNGYLTYDPEPLIKRFEKSGIKTDFLVTGYIRYRFTTDRIAETLKALNTNQSARMNRDMVPSAYFYQNLFWLDHFYPKLSTAFEMMTRYIWPFIIILMIFFSFSRVRAPVASIGAAGFTLMALEVAVILTYQIKIGFLYYKLALLISMLMLGMAAGVIYAIRKPRPLYIYHVAIAIFSLALIPLVRYLNSELAIFSLAIVSGFLGGSIFPVANSIYLSDKDNSLKTGSIYACDLAGSSIGAIIPALVIIPVFGITNSFLLVAVVNLTAILIFFRRRPVR